MNRRSFLLAGVSSFALAAPGMRSLQAAPAALARSNATASNLSWAQKFNDGKSQVNLNFLQPGGDYPFLNCLKTAQNWMFIDNSGWPDPSSLDADGYPTVITNRGVYTVFFVPSQAARPGNYVVTWNGNGTIFCGMNNTPVSGSKTSTNGSGRYVFSTTATNFAIGISSIGNPRITNLQVFHVSDEAALNAGQVFGSKFKQRLIEANFGVIRFLNWQSANKTNVTTWATRKPISYVFYAGSEFRTSLYAGQTTNVGGAYSANLQGFKLEDKATVIVKFNTSFAGPCTLNMNGTGAIPILNEYAGPLSTGTNSYPVGGTWQSLATLVYDATLNSWIKQGGDIEGGSVGLRNGCPPELMVRLCAEVGAHPYFVTPPLAIDPATDFMSSLAAYCRDNGPSWMVPRFEGPNELWNFAAGFYQSGYAKAKAAAYGWGNDVHNWYGKVMSVLGQSVSSVYADDRKRYQVLCGVQTAMGFDAAGVNSCKDRLASAKYLSQAAAPQSPYTKTPASKWVTHVACAQYITPSEYNTSQEQLNAVAFSNATSDRKIEIASAYASSVLSGTGQFTVPSVAKMYANWKSWAKSFGIQKMCGYEGGYSPDLGSNATINALRVASKQAAVLTTATTQNYRNFVSLTDSAFTAEFPSCFQLSGLSPSTSAWSVLEDIYQSPAPPQWSAIVAFNNSK